MAEINNKLHMLLSNSRNKPENRILKMPSIKDNFGLTKSEFERCVENLKSGFSNVLSQGLIRQLPESMTYLQNKFQVNRETSYDVCMNTFLIFRSKIILEKIRYGNLRFLFTRMCVNTYLDQKKKEQRISEAINSFHANKNESNINSEEFFEKLDLLISKLPDNHRTLMKAIYFSSRSMEEIAKDHGISYANLRKKKQRILQSLKTDFFKPTN